MKTGELVNGSFYYENAFTEDDIKAIQVRNAERVAEAKERLGTTYLLHPVNKVERSSQPYVLTPNALMQGY